MATHNFWHVCASEENLYRRMSTENGLLYFPLRLALIMSRTYFTSGRRIFGISILQQFFFHIFFPFHQRENIKVKEWRKSTPLSKLCCHCSLTVPVRSQNFYHHHDKIVTAYYLFLTIASSKLVTGNVFMFTIKCV